MINLGQVYPSPGFLNEIVYLYAATGLIAGEVSPDEDEFVEHVRMPFAEFERKSHLMKFVMLKLLWRLIGQD